MSDTPGFDLVADAQAGDADAFAELWRRYQPSVQRFIGKRVRDRGTVEDLTSEVFLRGWQSINTVRDQGQDIGAWFTTIARNKVADYYKSPSLGRVVVPAQPIEPWWPGMPTTDGPDVTVPDQHGRAAIAQVVDQYVSQLTTAHQRDAVRMRFTDELSGEQIGQALGCTAAGARRAYHRATLALRKRFAEDGHTTPGGFTYAAAGAPVRKPAA